MTEVASPFSLGPELAQDGTFQRQESTFRNWVSADGSSAFPAAAGRYHLYASRPCPWAHRTIIGRRLKGLEHIVSLSLVDPIRDSRGWAFTDGTYSDPINGFRYLSEAYQADDPDFHGRASVPVLWDKETSRIVSNESNDILSMLNSGFGALADEAVDLYPEALRTEIDALDARVYDTVNNGVYKAGFSTDQAVYEREVQQLFATLDELDQRLATRRFLFGDHPVQSDWRLFPTLVRFDAVYYIHFKCSVRRIADYPSLWPYLRDLYQQPAIAETVDLEQIRAHYYRSHPMVNPSGLVAVRPDLDLTAPHHRERLG